MTIPTSDRSNTELIGLFPAAGLATRLAASLVDHPEQNLRARPKELLPVRNIDAANDVPVGDYLVQNYRTANITQLAIITRPEKQSLITHYNSERFADFTLFPSLLESSPSTVHSIDAAYEHLQGKTVAMGFPDIIVRPQNVFTELLTALEGNQNEVVLGLFPVTATHKFDMVDYTVEPTLKASGQHISRIGTVKSIDIKPQHTSLTYTWVCAVWKPAFTEFLHELVGSTDCKKNLLNGSSMAGGIRATTTTFAATQHSEELYVGNVFQQALKQNIKISCVEFTHGRALDIGTPEDFELARSDALIHYFSA